MTLGWLIACPTAIAKSLNSKIYCDARKAAILRCQADQELDALLTSDPIEGFVHLVPLGTITTDRLKIYLERFSGHYNKVIGFRPTGWTYVPFCSLKKSLLTSVQLYTISRIQPAPFHFLHHFFTFIAELHVR